MNLKVEFAFSSGTVRKATRNIVDSHVWPGEITGITPIHRAIGKAGTYDMGGISITMDDSAGSWRAFMRSSSRYILGDKVTVYDENDNVYYTGAVEGWGFPPRGFTIRVKDLLIGLSDELPGTVISESNCPEPPSSAQGEAVPIIFHVSQSVGGIKAWKKSMGVYWVAIHHCKSIDGVWDKDENEISSGWSIDNNADGNCYLNFPTGTEEFYVLNVKGLMDGSSNHLTDPIETCKKVIDDFTVMDYDSTSFAAVKAIMVRYKYKMAGAIASTMTVSDFLAKFAESFACDWFIGKDRKIGFCKLDYDNLDPAAYYSEKQITGYELPETEIQDGSMVNRIRYQFGYNFASKDYALKPYYNNISSQTNWKNIFPDSLGLIFVADDVTASDIAQRIGLQRKNPRLPSRITLPRHLAYSRDLGELISVKHPEGIEDDYRLQQIVAIDTDALGEAVVISLIDIDELRQFSGFLLGDSTAISKWWTGASEANKAKYGWLASSVTGQFSDGAPGKGL